MKRKRAPGGCGVWCRWRGCSQRSSCYARRMIVADDESRNGRAVGPGDDFFGGRFPGRRCAVAQAMGTDGPVARNHRYRGRSWRGKTKTVGPLRPNGPDKRQHHVFAVFGVDGADGRPVMPNGLSSPMMNRGTVGPLALGLNFLGPFPGRRCAVAQAMGTNGPLARKRKHGRNHKGPASRTGQTKETCPLSGQLLRFD